jgi:hypothetical protein
MWERLISMSSRNPLTLLASIATWLPIMLAIYGRKNLTSELKILLFYLLIYATFDISEWVMALQKKNNLYIHNISEWVGMLITGWLYAKIVESSSIKKKIVIVLTLIAVVNSIFKFDWEEIAGYSFTLNKAVIITFVFLHFHSIITEVKVSNILQHPPFWISAAFLISACGMLFIYLFSHYTLATTSQMEMFRLYNNIGQAFIFIFMILLSFAFWTSKFTKQDV